MVASPSFAGFLHEQLAPLGRLSLRRMFGKTGVFCNGVMFAMVADDTLYLRVDDHNREGLSEAAGYPPLNYEKQGKSIDLAFWRAPERLMDDQEELLRWSRLALEAAHRVATQRQGRAPRRSTPE